MPGLRVRVPPEIRHVEELDNETHWIDFPAAEVAVPSAIDMEIAFPGG
jgi:hypothetical protein